MAKSIERFTPATRGKYKE